MSIAQNFPNLKPSLLLDFSNTEALDSRVTFTRASTATYYGTQTAKAEQNLLLQSQTFDNAGWAKSNTSVTANTEVAPDGTTTAETITATASTNFHIVNQTSASTTGTTRTFSLFAKKGTHNFVQLYLNADSNVFANFNLDAGTVGTVGSASTATITNVGNDWYRCVMTTSSATANNVAVIAIISSATAAIAESWTTAGTETVFLWGAQLEQRDAVTAYTPTTTQPITNYIPVLQTAASGVARFDHNPTTFESLGLLIEESRTNVLTYSEEFDNAAWTKTRATITANTIVAPDGTLTGDKLVENTDTNTHVVSQSTSFTSGTTYTMTVYAKAGERPALILSTGPTATSGGAARFNLTTGVATQASGTLASLSMTAVGNGWYRCQITQAATSTASDSWQIRPDTGSTSSYTGDGYSGLYIWGAQLESSSFSTSYIPTVASQVTRAADAASMTGTNFSSWYNTGEGSFYSEARKPSALASAIVWSANDNSTNNRQSAVYVTTTQLRYRSITNNINDAVITQNVSADDYAKAAGAYKVNDFAFSTDGGASSTDTSALVPVISQLNIGAEFNNSSILNGHIRKIAYYPLRVTNAQLQGLTS